MGEIVSYYKHLGRYDLCSNKKQWQVVLQLPEGRRLSEVWDYEDEPDIESLPPSQVVEIISERTEQYLYKTSRDKDRSIIAWCRDNSDEIDSIWAKQKIKELELRIEGLEKYIRPRFAKTYCSQCGNEFGPGDAGFSHCSDHTNYLHQ